MVKEDGFHMGDVDFLLSRSDRDEGDGEGGHDSNMGNVGLSTA